MPKKRKVALASIGLQIDRAKKLARELQPIDADILFETGFPRSQAVVMRALAERPGISQADLVELTGIDRSTTSQIVTNLAKKGLVARTNNKIDKRRYMVRLTLKGERVYKNGA